MIDYDKIDKKVATIISDAEAAESNLTQAMMQQHGLPVDKAAPAARMQVWPAVISAVAQWRQASSVAAAVDAAVGLAFASNGAQRELTRAGTNVERIADAVETLASYENDEDDDDDDI